MTQDQEPGDIPDDGPTFDEFMSVESVLPEWTEVWPEVDYVTPDGVAHLGMARFSGAMRARGLGGWQVRSLVRRDGVAMAFLEVEVGTLESVARDVLAAVVREDRRRRGGDGVCGGMMHV